MPTNQRVVQVDQVKQFMASLPQLPQNAREQALKAYINGATIQDDQGNDVELQTIFLPASDDSADDNASNDESLSQLVRQTLKSVIAEQRASKPARSPLNITPTSRSAAVMPVKRFGSLKSFRGNDAQEQAYHFGRWVMACLGSAKSTEFCKSHGIALHKAHEESVNSTGGFLVPDQFQNTLIDLREQYGVFRRNARVVPMTSDTLNVPRRTGGLTTYWVGENQSVTESTKGWDRVTLTAKKLGVLSKYSSELAEDAIINLADDLAGEISYAFALKEDQAGFTGDGSSTYAGIVGVCQKLEDVTSAGIVETADAGTDSDWSLIDLSDFSNVVGKLPEYAETPSARWYCSKAFFGAVMQKLVYAAGGNTVEQVSDATRRTFLGYPVEVTQVMPTAADSAEIVCLFGDLRQASMFGDRRMTTLAFSEHVNFSEDEIAIRGTQRFDINVHDVGSSTAAGPMVALKSKA